MGAFICDKCNSVENTATGHYWDRNMDYIVEEQRGLALCSACGPHKHVSGKQEPKGKWHGRFKRVVLTAEMIANKEYDVSDLMHTRALDKLIVESKGIK